MHPNPRKAMNKETSPMDRQFSIFRCKNIKEVHSKIFNELDKRADVLPRSNSANIFLKLNLNSNMNSLTGNTTDLRIIASVVEFLKDRGYKNITLGDGTSSGFYRNKINMFSRLKVDELAKKYGVATLDLNYAPSKEIDFENGDTVRVARICFETDFFINLPKVKMHFEAMMSVCLKNMVGCLVGLWDKQKTHSSLFKNILNLNKYIKPDLHIVDGLIGMEGNGPSSGTPIKLDFIAMGSNPYLLDMVCAKIACVDYKDVPCLALAEETGIITPEYNEFIDTIDLKPFQKEMKRPNPNFLVSLVNDQRWQRHLIRLRLAPGISDLFKLNIVGKALNATGLRQDVFLKEDTKCQGLNLLPEKCTDCKVCADYCPAGLDLPRQIGERESGCLYCMYCFLICPEKAVEFEGELGFMTEQLRQYDQITRDLSKEEGHEPQAIQPDQST